MEIWKDIIDYEGYYQVSNLGQIRSLDRLIKNSKNDSYHIKKGSIMKLAKSRNYHCINLCKNGIIKHFIVSRLVAQAFIPNPYNKPDVGHKFGDKSDNRAISLQWETRSENMEHSFKTGLHKWAKGEQSGKSKLTEKQVLEIRRSNLKQCELAIIYNVNVSTISGIITRRYWKHI